CVPCWPWHARCTPSPSNVHRRASPRQAMALSNARQRHFFVRRMSVTVTRRNVLKLSAVAALAAGLPSGWRGAAYGSDAPETPKMRLGIIALTDCSSIVMAHELGLFKMHGIESTISKEA